MNESSDVRDRLNRLNALRSAGRAASAYPSSPTRGMPANMPPALPALMGSPQPIDALFAGDTRHNALGSSYMIPTRHTPDHVHGSRPLSAWLVQDLAGAAAFSRDPRLLRLDPRRCAFLDTETTGLSAGAGTLVFLIGIGVFTDQGFEVRQFFLRDPAEEPAMLHAIQTLLQDYDALVTFNGRSFDVPLLTSRYTLNRQRTRLDSLANLDLLHPARRLWKRRLESCRLSALETAILQVRRTNDDVPGMLIPQLYHDYLRTGDARYMQRVIYHNLIDVLSMVTLAAHLCETFAQPSASDLPCDDLISLARWYDGLGKSEQAEVTYAAALSAARHGRDKATILECLAALLKRQERWHDAAACWQTLTELLPTSTDPRIELAKYHEWHNRDFEQARAWTHDAIRVANTNVVAYQREALLADLQHRLARLDHK